MDHNIHNSKALSSSAQPLQTMLQDSLPHSLQIATKSCQNLFRWDRWNCPTSDFQAKKSSRHFDRETVFVQSLALAALAFSVMRNCSRDDFDGCQCSVQFEGIGLDGDRLNCSDSIDDLVDQITGSVDRSTVSRSDAYEYARVHNVRAARIVRYYEIQPRESASKVFVHSFSGAETVSSPQLSMHRVLLLHSELLAIGKRI